jgi:hypothetical protein
MRDQGKKKESAIEMKGTKTGKKEGRKEVRNYSSKRILVAGPTSCDKTCQRIPNRVFLHYYTFTNLLLLNIKNFISKVNSIYILVS